MRPISRSRALIAATVGVLSLVPVALGQVVINEFQYDDTGTDNLEFVELYNPGPNPVDISGWFLTGEDQSVGSASIGTIASGTTLAAGGYFVLGQVAVPNVNQTLPTAGPIQNDMETIELRDSAATLVDAVIYEVNKGSFSTASLTTVAGPGIWMNHQGVEAPAGILTTTLARYRDGVQTNNNGRDFGMRPATPGTNNNAAGVMTTYVAPNVNDAIDGSTVPGLTGSFVNGRAIDPTVVSAANPNAIPNPANSNRAIVAWDNSGGGNGVVSNQVFTNSTASYRIQAYLDTNDLPVQFNSSNVQFRGSEETFYGLLGTIDAFTNLSDVSGNVGLGTGTTSGSNGVTGNTGLAWYYEKVGVSPSGAPVSEKLYLIDASDGGNSNAFGGTQPFHYNVLQTIDLSATASGWYELGISVDAAGNGVGFFNGQTFNFTTATNLTGAFYVGYRENLQEGAVGVPAYARPATFADVPEPAGLGLVGLTLAGLIRRRK